MSEYQLQITQIVDYPRCRIYRQFVQSLLMDQNIRTRGSSGLFYFTVLCSYAAFNPSFCRIDGISYTIYPGEWICTVKELSDRFRTHSRGRVIKILDELQKRHLISYLALDRGKVVKYKVQNWKIHNTVLDDNCLCQKDTGFFFLPVTTTMELVGAGRCSEMDSLLDMWMSAVYNDGRVQGSKTGPVVYLRNGTGSTIINRRVLATRWGVVKMAVDRRLSKFERLGYISRRTVPGTGDFVISLENFLSAMFQMSDMLTDKEEIALKMCIRLNLPEEKKENNQESALRPEICVQGEWNGVPKAHVEIIIRKVAELLNTQGCFHCPKATYRLHPLPDGWERKYLHRIGSGQERERQTGLAVFCGNSRAVYRFELSLAYAGKKEEESK